MSRGARKKERRRSLESLFGRKKRMGIEKERKKERREYPYVRSSQPSDGGTGDQDGCTGASRRCPRQKTTKARKKYQKWNSTPNYFCRLNSAESLLNLASGHSNSRRHQTLGHDRSKINRTQNMVNNVITKNNRSCLRCACTLDSSQYTCTRISGRDS